MIKNVIIAILLVTMCVVFGFAQGGTYTTNSYFYMPLYGASGTTEFDEYNAYMQIADTQIEANKVLGEAAVSTSGVPVANDIARFTGAAVIEGRSYAEFKVDLDLEIGTDILAQQTIGIADDNLLEVDGLSNANEYARFTANGLVGRTEAEFKGDFNLEIGTDVQAHNSDLDDFATWAGAGWATGRVITYEGATGKPAYPDIQVFKDTTDMFVMHEVGGLEANVSAYSGLVAVSGGSTAEVDALAELEAQIADVTHFVVEGVACSDLEGTLLAIAGGTLNAAIPADHVTAAMLADDNSPADEDIYSYESTGPTGHWYSRDEVGIKFSKFDATQAPTVNNDTDEGYVVGSNWVDVTNDDAYVCLDNTDGAAVWSKAAPGGGGGSVDTSGTPVDNDIAMFTDADTIEGRSSIEHKSDINIEIVFATDYGAGAGTVGDPWDTSCIEGAYTACPTGGTIYLEAGYYTLDDATFTIAKALNFIGEGRGRTFIKTQVDTEVGITVTADYVTLKGFTLDGDSQTDGAGTPYLLNITTTDYARVDDIEVKNAGESGLNLPSNDYGIFTNIYAHDNYEHGVHSSASDTVDTNRYNIYQNIYCYDNTEGGFDEWGNETTPTDPQYNIYDNIQAWGNGSRGISICNMRNATITNCTVTGSTTNGMYLNDLTDVNISDCQVTLSTSHGIEMYDGENINFTNVIVKNSANTKSGIVLSDCLNVTFTNCQSYDDRGSPFQEYAVEFYAACSKISLINCKLQPNVSATFYNNGASSAFVVLSAVDDDIRMGDGVWTNYIKVTDAGVLTLEGTANIEGVSDTEFSYVDGVTSDIQTQLDAKEGDLSNEAGLYSALSDVSLFLEDTIDDTSPELGGEMDSGAHSIGFTLQSTTGDGTTTMDWRLGNKFKFTFGAQNETFTFTAPTNPCTLMLTIIQDATGSRTITWPATVKWPDGTAPTLTTTANARDKVALDWDGTQYDGVVSLDFK